MDTYYFQIQGFALGTSYNMVFEAKDANGMQDEVESLIADFEHSLSVYKSDSIISRVNRNEEVVIDKYFESVFMKAQEIYRKSEGLFDMSAEPLFKAWGFSFAEKQDMTDARINELMQYIGMNKLSLENGRIVKENPSLQLNANAIAKGYVVDVIADWLSEQGIENYLVEVGGEIRTSGISPRGGGWVIGVDRPSETNLMPGQDVQVMLELSDKALATSGNYRQFYVKDGQKISHTINPKTGYPVSHTLLSVTVLADDAMSADAYATAFLVAGIDSTLELLDNIDNVEVLFICDEDGEYKVHYTAGLDKYILQ